MKMTSWMIVMRVQKNHQNLRRRISMKSILEMRKLRVVSKKTKKLLEKLKMKVKIRNKRSSQKSRIF